MRDVYVVISATNTGVGSFIRFFTRKKYCHAAFAFDSHLTKMYSFGRIHYHTPLAGSFVVELPRRFLHDGEDIDIKLFRLKVTDAEYKRLRREIDKFERQKNNMVYDLFGALLSYFGKKNRLPNCFTCISFVSDLIGIDCDDSVSKLEEKLADDLIYEGSLRKIVGNKLLTDDYYIKMKRREIVYETLRQWGRLLWRAVGG